MGQGVALAAWMSMLLPAAPVGGQQLVGLTVPPYPDALEDTASRTHAWRPWCASTTTMASGCATSPGPVASNCLPDALPRWMPAPWTASTRLTKGSDGGAPRWCVLG